MKGLGAKSYGTHHEVNFKKLGEYRNRGYLTFTVVRNHWEMVASWWCVNRGMQTTNGVEGFHWDPSWDEFVIEWPNTISIREGFEQPHRMFWLYQNIADVIIEYDSLHAGLHKLFKYEVPLQLHGKSTRGPYREQYTSEQRDFIGEWYADEIRHYGYEF
jgi:hypothetical protein